MKPPFAMSKYVSELELHKDAHRYYKDEADKLRAVLSGLEIKHISKLVEDNSASDCYAFGAEMATVIKNQIGCKGGCCNG